MTLHRLTPGRYRTSDNGFEIRRIGDSESWDVWRIRTLSFGGGEVKYHLRTFTGLAAFRFAKEYVRWQVARCAKRSAELWGHTKGGDTRLIAAGVK